MAVIGNLHEVLKNHVFPEHITKGLMYLATLTEDAFSALAPGEVRRVDLQGEALFALNQVYETRDLDQAKFEAHRRYIDIQYVFEGHETLRLACIDGATPVTEFDEEKDFRLYDAGDYSTISFQKGMVCILYPADLHAPCLDWQGRSLIKKTVIKVRVNPAKT
ncbi:MAG: YhcH/YjgK/YiaL family protein [Syntrophaceae bacterium]